MQHPVNGAAAVRGRFYGGRASGDEERRAGKPFWAKGHAAVREMLSDMPRDSRVLDIPVGTGRFAPIYQEFEFDAVGMDVSKDMLAIALKKCRSLGFSMYLMQGDILEIPAPDRSHDAVICTRLLNWILPNEMARALAEMMRVCKQKLIVSIELGERTSDKGNKPHEPAAFGAAIIAIGGKIEKRVNILPNYWMMQIGRC